MSQAATDEIDDDPSMGPCSVCKILGSECRVHHTSCECELEDPECRKVICDDCRYAGGNWAWIDGEHDDDTREVHIDCYHRMASKGLVQNQKTDKRH